MSRGKTKRLAWQLNHNRYKKDNAIYRQAYKKIFKQTTNCTENELRLKRARNRLKEITRRIDGCNGRMTKQQH